MKKKIVLILFIIIFSLNFVSAGGGGGAVRITTIELTEQGNDYNIKPTRLKFEFDGNLYAIQVRRVKPEYVNFLVMTLDMDKPNNITAYTLDNSFSLSPSERREIDIDRDGTNDIFIELNDIISTGEHNSVRSADFSIRKTSSGTQPVVTDNSTQESEDNVGEELSSSMDEVVIIRGGNLANFGTISLMKEPSSKTIFEKLFNFFKTLF